MAKVVCKNCGATGWSKNPETRSVFPDCQDDAVLSHLLKFPKIEDGWATFTIRLRCDDVEEAFRNLISITNVLEKVGVKNYCCNHKWVLAEGEKAEC